MRRASWPRARSRHSWSVAATHQFAPSKPSQRRSRLLGWPMTWSRPEWPGRWSSRGNVTGVSIFAPELDGKRQELLIELLPGVPRMAALADPRVQPPQQLQALQDAARARGVELSIHRVTSADAIVPAITAAKAAG